MRITDREDEKSLTSAALKESRDRRARYQSRSAREFGSAPGGNSDSDDPDFHHPFYPQDPVLLHSNGALVYETLSRPKRAQFFLCLMPLAYEFLRLNMEDLLWSHWCLYMQDFHAIDMDTTPEMRKELGLHGRAGFYDRVERLYHKIPSVQGLWNNVFGHDNAQSRIMT